MKKILCLLLPLLCLLASVASAQIELRLEPVRRDFITGEDVALKLTLTNHTDATINLEGTSGRPWLSILLYRTGENLPVSPTALARFPKLSLSPGSTRAFQLNIKEFYKLDTSGTYRAVATVRQPGTLNTYSSNRATFALISGGTVRNFQVQARGRRLELAVKLATTGGHDNLFGQVTDIDTHCVVGACFLGRYVSFMKPIVKLDSAQNIHVICQSTPDVFSYAIMDTHGKRRHYQLYKRTGGPVDLVGGGKGLTPVGLTPYNPTKQNAPTYHNVSERPF